MAEQTLAGVLIGASSMLLGYILHQAARARSEQASYLHHVPRFSDFGKLQEHLRSSASAQDGKAEVMVEGVVQKLGNASIVSDRSGVEGTARIITTTTYSKVHSEDSNKWRDVSNTIENVNVSLPFRLVDAKGNQVRVDSIHTAGGYRQQLQRVFQEKTLPEQRSVGDFATGMTLKEIPNGSLVQEFMLVFGTPLAGYGTASLSKKSLLSTEVVFVPVEVASSVAGLISRNEIIAGTFRFFSFLFLVGGGSLLVLSIAPPLVKSLLHPKSDSDAE